MLIYFIKSKICGPCLVFSKAISNHLYSLILGIFDYNIVVYYNFPYLQFSLPRIFLFSTSMQPSVILLKLSRYNGRNFLLIFSNFTNFCSVDFILKNFLPLSTLHTSLYFFIFRTDSELYLIYITFLGYESSKTIFI